MISLLVRCGIDDKDALVGELYERGTSGILEKEVPGGECLLEAFFDTEESACALLSDFATRRPTMLNHESRDYVAEFQAHWQPMAVGSRIWLAAPWDDRAAPDGRVRLSYQTGMACGSGVHPCTRLCLEALEQAMRPGARVLDVGAGSGILLMAANLLGASAIAGCDIDADSVGMAGAAIPEALLFVGSTRSLRDASFDVVIANIGPTVARTLCGELHRLCRPSGTVIVSGFRMDEIPEDYRGEQVEMEGWACVVERPFHPRAA